MKKTIMIAAAIVLACTAASAQTLKFAHVNFGELVQLMPEMDSARVQIDAASRETQETYQSMMMEFQNKYQEYQQKQSTWTPAVRGTKEKELGDIQTRIQEFEQASQQDLTQLQNTLMAPIYQKAQDKVHELAKAQGVIYVFDSSSLLYVDSAQSTDLTPAAREALNIPANRTLESLQAELQAQAQAAAAQQQ